MQHSGKNVCVFPMQEMTWWGGGEEEGVQLSPERQTQFSLPRSRVNWCLLFVTCVQMITTILLRKEKKKEKGHELRNTIV